MPLISQSFQSIWMECGTLLRLVSVMNLIILFGAFNIQGREPYLCDFVHKQIWRWLVFRHLPTDFFQTWHVIRYHWILHFDISLVELDLSFKIIVVWEIKMKNKKSCVLFLLNFAVDLDETQYVATPCWVFKLVLNFFCTRNIQGRELCWCDFMKYVLNIVLYQDTCERICFRFSMMLNRTILYSLIPVWMILMYTQCHRVTGNLELVQAFCCKAAWSSSNVRDGWLCKGDKCEEFF